MTEQQTSTEEAAAAPARKALIQTMRGRVVSDKMNKTVTVLVERRVKHALYDKIVIQSRKFHAHDENNECKTGDLVEISATRKLSKTKAWRVSNILERADGGAGGSDRGVASGAREGSGRGALEKAGFPAAADTVD